MHKPMVTIKVIAAAALASIDSVLAHWLPGGKSEGTEYMAVNPTRADSRPGSFSINTTTGRWGEFATGDKGGDAVSLVAYLEGCKQLEAARKLGIFLGVIQNDGDTGDIGDKPKKARTNKEFEQTTPPRGRGDRLGTLGTKGPILPIPAQVSPLPPHPKHGKPVQVWTYRDPDGNDMFYVARYQPKGGRKQIVPITWWPDGWQFKGVSAPRPLYNLDLINQDLEGAILVVEGEKAADAASILLPDLVATTSPNGAKAADKADWSPLAGRKVRIWPDADEPGAAYAQDVAARAYTAGAESVEIIDLDALAVAPDGGEARTLPKGWDAADAISDGWKAPTIAAAARWQPVERPKSEIRTTGSKSKNRPESENVTTGDNSKNRPKNAAPDRQRPYFDATEAGVFYYGVDKTGEDLPPLRICSPLWVRAYTRSKVSEDWGRLLEFPDRDGTLHRWAMPMALLRGSGEELRGELLRMGVEITTHQAGRRLLGDYLQGERPSARVRCVTSTGWHSGAYVFPDHSMGGDEQFVYQSETLASVHYGTSGSLADWRENVAAFAIGNSRLSFTVSLAFASILLNVAGDESGGIHLRDGSSTGKTTALYLAGSCFGPNAYVEKWRATDNGLEALAEQHNHALLILDEIAQIDSRVAGEAAYMLANGSGKARADRSGGARATKRWQLLFLSSGEIGLADHMLAGGKRAKAGQEIRMADIPADAGKGMGIFEQLHGHADGAAFSRAIREATAQHYGTAAPAFIEKCIEHADELPVLVSSVRSSFVDEALADAGEKPSGQAHRVAARFGLVAAAGELATAWGITGWQPHEAARAARTCFRAWLDGRGGGGDLEELNTLRQVRRFFELHGEARFSAYDRALDDHAPRTSNRAGFVRHDASSGSLTYYVMPEVYRSEICEGFDAKRATEVLVRRGMMLATNEGTAARDAGARREALPGYERRVRCYVFTTAAWGDD